MQVLPEAGKQDKAPRGLPHRRVNTQFGERGADGAAVFRRFDQ